MPSVRIAPLQLAFSGGNPSFDPPFTGVTPLALKFVFPTIKAGPGLPNLSKSVTTPKLDRLQRLIQYFNPDGTPTPKMVLDWQNTMQAIEAAFAGLTGQVGDLSILVAQIQAAQDLAQTANSTANQNLAQTNITNSYTTPTAVLTADSTGTITIASHQRTYGDGRVVSVNGGTITGFSPDNYVSVYYDDPSREGGTVMYQGSLEPVAQAGDRHSVGQITIPQAGSPPVSGGGVSPPGYTPNTNITPPAPE